jgi:hypothetical protein
MSGASFPCPLVAQLLQMLPGAQLVKCERSDWHSATFAGERVVVTLGHCDAQRAEDFAWLLPDAEFGLQGRFVADILVSDVLKSEDGAELTVEALILDE